MVDDAEASTAEARLLQQVQDIQHGRHQQVAGQPEDVQARRILGEESAIGDG